MCLIAVAWRATARRPLIVAANRDESHQRPTEPAHWWPDAPRILAGRDVLAGGTWLGVDASGRFAAVTNLRTAKPLVGKRSRGALVADFLRGDADAERYAASIASDVDAYGAFNLLVCDREALWFVGTGSAPRELPAGVHALSNVEPGVDWPKVKAARERLASIVDAALPEEAIFEFLAERAPPVDGYDERQISPFQLDPSWGTRSSTIVIADAAGHIRFVERSFDAAGTRIGEVRHEFTASRRA